MAWSGKVLGGVLGGMVGGPLGAGFGAALGHVLADGEAAGKTRDLVLVRLLWRHHAFGPSGPCVRVTPVWRARRHADRDVRVRIEAGSHRESALVTPEADDELCEVPDFLLPYAGFAGTVRVRLEGPRGSPEVAEFEVELPNPVRRLGSSGPARVVMALVGAARAGGRTLVRDDVRFIRETFVAAYPLDADGIQWLRAWLRELRDADLDRLSPEKVATRLAKHVEGPAVAEVLLWLMRGTREVWPGAAAVEWITQLGRALGVAEVDTLWTELDAVTDEPARARARKVLGVGPEATEDEARAAWRRLVQQWHPDRARTDGERTEATRRIAEINAAWRVLQG